MIPQGVIQRRLIQLAIANAEKNTINLISPKKVSLTNYEPCAYAAGRDFYRAINEVGVEGLHDALNKKPNNSIRLLGSDSIVDFIRGVTGQTLENREGQDYCVNDCKVPKCFYKENK